MLRASLSLLLLLAACDRPDRKIEQADVSPSSLEMAALKAGVIVDAAKVTVPGLYQRRHEAGRDTLCITPGNGVRYDFGLEAMFGPEEYCRGEGTARRVGDKLILHFSGRSQCLIVARYDGDRVAIPGVVDMKCAELCNDRASLEGVVFPRLPSGPRGPEDVRDRDGSKICIAGD